MSKHAITLNINGKDHPITVDSNELLLNVLRERLFLTGAKYGCGIAECGACSIIVDGELFFACLVPAVAADGWKITTPEGLADGLELNPVQQAFIDHAAIQCGFCVPGMVTAGTTLLMENSDPDEEYVKDYLRGNFCRCTGYVAMVESVLDASSKWDAKWNR